MEDEEKKRGPGGARPGAGRPSTGGRKKGIFVSLDDEELAWFKEQPEGPPEYTRRLAREDKKRRT